MKVALFAVLHLEKAAFCSGCRHFSQACTLRNAPIKESLQGLQHRLQKIPVRVADCNSQYPKPARCAGSQHKKTLPARVAAPFHKQFLQGLQYPKPAPCAGSHQGQLPQVCPWS
eukprot:1138223-Pelagomonas_calceolata.AAC.9